MNEHQKAQAWRRKMGWSIDQLSELSGYSVSSIWWMERGEVAPSASRGVRPVNEFAWQRYKRVCAAVDHEQKTGKTFDW